MTYFTTQVPNIASEVFDSEVVIADFVSGTYYSLTGAGVAVWQGLATGRSVEDVAGWMAGHYGMPLAEISAAVDALIGAMHEAKLISPVETPAPETPLPQLQPAVFEAPHLEAFTDLADLLLLDPVHDVAADAGWPHLPPTSEST